MTKPNFSRDDEWQRQQVKRIQAGGGLPRNLIITDTPYGFDAKDGWEIKTVRKEYTAFTLETWSNYGIREGWMLEEDISILAYYMQMQDKNNFRMFWLDFGLLQDWFFDNNNYLRYYAFDIVNPGRNTTVGRVVPIKDIPERFYFIKDAIVQCTP